MSQKDFRQVCVLSGTDYHMNKNHSIGLYDSLRLFQKYKQSANRDFYYWLQKQKYLSIQVTTLYEIYDMFDLSSNRFIPMKI